MSSPRGNHLPNLRPASPAHASGRLHRVPSSEVLNAHPLLSPGPTASLSSSNINANGTSSSNSSLHSSESPVTGNAPPPHHSAQNASATTATKYLPYTPRQARVVTGSATAGTANSPVSVSPQLHQHSSGVTAPSATSRLQLQNLKAVTQHHGLDASCLGWAILEELVAGSDHTAAWTEVWGVIATGKAALLLPTEVANSREAITPEFVKDHIIFCESSAREKAPFVTLSGLRGTIDGDDVLIQSSIPTSSKLFKALSDAATRSSALTSLPPLPELSNSSPNYPKFVSRAFIPSLPLPPRSIPAKPPLPPRPGAKPAPHVSRLSNPFASFFSKSSAPATPSPTSHTPTDVPPVDHVVEVPAYTIDRALVRRNISKTLAKCIKAEIKESLSGLPSWVIDRVQSFSSSLLPFPRPSQKGKDWNNASQVSSDQSSIMEVSAYDDLAEELSQRFQEFYESLEEELRVEGSPSTLRRKDDRHNEEEKAKEKNELDAKVRSALEKVEHALTCTFYDRLYRPSSSDDASHDEALSSRIAALNKVDLNLDHLGVDAGDVKDDVYRIVEACGQTVSQLEVAHCPADKAAILVASHRIIVDGLSRLPPLHLKSEESMDDERTPQGPAFSRDVQSEDGLRGRNKSPVKPIKTDVDPLSSHTQSNPPEKELEEIKSAEAEKTVEESKTNETIKIPLLEDGASVDSVPLFTLSPAAEEPPTPLLSVSPPKTPTPVSGDILLPLIIFSVVKANPPQLVSHLLFTQRFRNQSVGGEESYCLINLMAVVEFLENVDLAALGLKESEKDIRSTADLTPIPLAIAADKTPASTPGGQAGLRGRVEQQVDAIAGSANKVLSGVVDSGFGVLRSLLPTAQLGDQSHPGTPGNEGAAPWNISRPGFGLLRRESGFSIASLAASLPGRDRARSIASSYHAADDEGQEMIESRPASVRGVKLSDGEEEEDDDEDEEEESEEDEDEEDEEGETRHDTRSIRSFESMMSERTRARRKRKIEKTNKKKERMSITDRLAHMSRSRLSKGSPIHSHEPSAHQGSPPPPVRTSSLLATKEPTRFDTPISSRTSSPAPSARPLSFTPLAPPSRRFLECSPDDLKMSEIPDLLREYRRLVEGIRGMGAFDEHS